MEGKLSYEDAVEKTAHEEYLEIEEQLAAAVAELDSIFKHDPDTVPVELIERITELQKLSKVRLQDWLESMGLA